MRIFKHHKKKQINEAKNLHKVKTNDIAGFSGAYKAIILAGTAFIIVALLVSAPLLSNKDDIIYSDIAILANEKLKSNDYSEAIELFKQAIKINPADDELYIGLADSYNAANESSMAREILETGYIETKSENIKIELEKLDEIQSESENLSSEKPEELSNESSLESKEQESSKEKSESDQSSEFSNESSQSSESTNIVTVNTFSDENLQKYSDTEIFKSTAEWFELTSKENLDGVEKVNASIKELLDKYFKLTPSMYGVEGEDEVYYLVKSKNKKIETKISAKVTYNSDYILSYVVDIVIQSPNTADSSSAIELHTIDMKTGDELSLSNIIGSDESNIKNIVIEAFANEGIELSESDFDSIKFYLDTDKIVLINASNKAYISIANITNEAVTSEASVNLSSETR